MNCRITNCCKPTNIYGGRLSIWMVFFIFLSFNSQAQTTIYFEDFESDTVGATTSALSQWTIDLNGKSPNYFEVRQVGGNKWMAANNTKGEVIWRSSIMDISCYGNVDVEASINLAEDGTLESGDYIRVRYILDGGNEINFETNGSLSDDFSPRKASQTSLFGNTLQIVIRMNNNDVGEVHRFDSIWVRGTSGFFTDLTTQICDEDSIFLAGEYRNTPGTYIDTINAANGCDSIVSTVLEVLDVCETCFETTLYKEDFNSYVNGTYLSPKWSRDLSQSNPNHFDVRNGQWSSRNTRGNPAIWNSSLIDISEHSSVSISLDISRQGALGSGAYIIANYILDGDTVEFANRFGAFTASTIGVKGIKGSQLRIQVITRTANNDDHYHRFDNVIVKGTQGALTILDVAICQGDSYFVGGANRTTSGTYFDTIVLPNFCDSIIATNLTVENFNLNENVSICPGDSILINGQYVKLPGSYLDSLTTVNGCDSLVMVNLTFSPCSAENPDLVPVCPMSIIFVLDESGSMSGSAATQLRNGTMSLLNALKGTGSRIAFVEFATQARRSRIGGTPDFQEVTDDNLQDYSDYLYGTGSKAENRDYYSPNSTTNWEAALITVKNMIMNVEFAPLVIFFTDGNPNVSTSSGTDHVGNAEKQADIIRGLGTHMFVVGVPNPTLNENRVQRISGPDKYPSPESDFTKGDYTILTTATLANNLRDIAGLICRADLSLTKTVDKPIVCPGDTVTFTIVVRNSGLEDAGDVAAVDTLPNGYTYLFDDGGVKTSKAGNVITWEIGDLPNDANDTLRITAIVNASGNYKNVAQITSSNRVDPDSTPGNDDGTQSEDDEDNASVTLSSLGLSCIILDTLTCNGNGEDAALTLNIMNPAGPVTIIWSTGDTTQTITGLGLGIYSVTVTDGGCVATCSKEITPSNCCVTEAICQDKTVFLDENGLGSIEVSDIDDGSETCGGTITIDPAEFDCSHVGENPVKLIVTGPYDSDTCTAIVTVVDLVKPNAECKDTTIQLDSEGKASITAEDIDDGSNDACGIASLDVTQNNFDCSDIGENIVTLTVIDNNDNSSTCTATVTVEPGPLAIGLLDTSICAGDSVFVGEAWQTMTGEYYDTLTAANGCDSVLITTLTVLPVADTTLNVSICEGEEYIVRGNQNLAGTYYDTLIAANGCDSIITINLTVLLHSDTTLNESICEGNSFFVAGEWQFTQGTYYDTLVAANGCDSVVITNLTVKPHAGSSVNESICEGDSFFVAGEWQFTQGTYYDTLVAANGCDSVVTTILTIKPHAGTTVNESICEGESFYAGGGNQTIGGAYYDTLVAANGCDSVVTTILTVKPHSFKTIEVTICEGAEYFAGGENQTDEGIYYDTLTAANGCDSIITTNLSVSTNYLINVEESICEGDSFFAGSAYRTIQGVYYDTLLASNDCDSVIATSLTVLPHTGSTVNEAICAGESFYAGGGNQTTEGTYYDTLVAANGCDSVVTTILTLKPHTGSIVNESICAGESFFAGGGNQTTEGNYYDTLVAANGCDSVITTILTIKPHTGTTVNESICEGDSFFVAGEWQFTQGTYYDTFVPANGCDSVVTTILAVLQNSLTQLNEDVCDEFFDLYGGVSTITLYDSLTGVNGCDSVVATTYTALVCESDDPCIEAYCDDNECVYVPIPDCGIECEDLEISGFTLMYEGYNGEVGPLTDGHVISLDTLCRFNIRADICEPRPVQVRSVRFWLNGSFFRNENVEPFAFNGDSPDGNYNPWSPKPGYYVVRARAYSGSNGGGQAGPIIEVGFTVVGATGNSSTNCVSFPVYDCANVRNGAAFIDECGECVGGTTGKQPDWAKDNCGVCFGDNACCVSDSDCDDGIECTIDRCDGGQCIHDDSGCIIDECVVEIVVVLDGSQEVLPTPTEATGSLTGTYSPLTNILSFTATFTGLEGTTTMAHFHGPAPAGTNGAAQITLTTLPLGVTSGNFADVFVLTDDQEAELLSGLWYINIHTTAYPGGEIRAQLIIPVICDDGDACTIDLCDPLIGCYTTPLNCNDGIECTIDYCDNGQCFYDFSGCIEDECAVEIDVLLDGSQEVLPTPTEATGNLIGIYNPSTRSLIFNVTFTGLEGVTTMAHFHGPAPAGTNGAAQITLTTLPMGVSSGNFSDSFVLTDVQETELLSELWYINIHTTAYPGGEIRAQLIVPAICDDGDVCTIDVCDDGGKCIFTPINCDDGDPCTIDYCDNGVCVNEQGGNEPSYLRTTNPVRSWRKLKLGYDPISLWGTPQNVLAGGNNQICLTLRDVNGNAEWNKIQVRPQSSSSGSVNLSSHIIGNPGTDWFTVCIPLSAFNPFSGFGSLTFIEVPYSNGANPFVIDIQKIEFTGGATPFLWFGDSKTDNYHDGFTGSGSTLPTTFNEGAPCGIGKRSGDESALFNDTEKYELYMNAIPNPFNERTVIEFKLPETMRVRLEIVNLEGRLVAVLFDGVADGNMSYNEEFYPGNVAYSMYFYRIITERGDVVNKKLLMTR